jgi:transcriptional regulator with XRE-family HTH domain
MHGRAMSLPIEELGRLIVAKRGSRGVRAAAADVGISSATLSRVENGHMPDLETFAKICKWLGKDPREFLGFDRDETASPQAVVQFRKDRTVSRETAVALGELILAAQTAIRARAKLID